MKSSRQVKTVLKYQQEGSREEREESWERRVLIKNLRPRVRHFTGGEHPLTQRFPSTVH
jgi:hypothetical protein